MSYSHLGSGRCEASCSDSQLVWSHPVKRKHMFFSFQSSLGFRQVDPHAICNLFPLVVSNPSCWVMGRKSSAEKGPVQSNRPSRCWNESIWKSDTERTQTRTRNDTILLGKSQHVEIGAKQCEKREASFLSSKHNKKFFRQRHHLNLEKKDILRLNNQLSFFQVKHCSMRMLLALHCEGAQAWVHRGWFA